MRIRESTRNGYGTRLPATSREERRLAFARFRTSRHARTRGISARGHEQVRGRRRRRRGRVRRRPQVQEQRDRRRRRGEEVQGASRVVRCSPRRVRISGPSRPLAGRRPTPPPASTTRPSARVDATTSPSMASRDAPRVLPRPPSPRVGRARASPTRRRSGRILILPPPLPSIATPRGLLVRQESDDDEAVKKTTLREVKVLRSLEHENVVSLKVRVDASARDVATTRTPALTERGAVPSFRSSRPDPARLPAPPRAVLTPSTPSPPRASRLISQGSVPEERQAVLGVRVRREEPPRGFRRAPRRVVRLDTTRRYVWQLARAVAHCHRPRDRPPRHQTREPSREPAVGPRERAEAVRFRGFCASAARQGWGRGGFAFDGLRRDSVVQERRSYSWGSTSYGFEVDAWGDRVHHGRAHRRAAAFSGPRATEWTSCTSFRRRWAG